MKKLSKLESKDEIVATHNDPSPSKLDNFSAFKNLRQAVNVKEIYEYKTWIEEGPFGIIYEA